MTDQQIDIQQIQYRAGFNDSERAEQDMPFQDNDIMTLLRLVDNLAEMLKKLLARADYIRPARLSTSGEVWDEVRTVLAKVKP